MTYNVLITGYQGLIGSFLVKQLFGTDINTIQIDNRFPPDHLHYGDIRDTKLLKKIIPNCQGIIHLAAVSRVVWGQQDPQLCWDVNVEGTRNLLNVALQTMHKPWIIYASSREVYGQQSIFPVTENAELMPLNIYARSKLAAEQLVTEYRQHGLLTAILRFSSVYGSANDYADRVIPAFCRAAVQNNILRVDGVNNVFDFTHVSDTVAGIILVMQKLKQGINNLPPIHLTTGNGTSLLDVVLLIQQVLNKKVVYKEAPARTYDVHQFYGDVTRSKELLAWEAKIALQQGLANLIAQYQAQQQTLISL